MRRFGLSQAALGAFAFLTSAFRARADAAARSDAAARCSSDPSAQPRPPHRRRRLPRPEPLPQRPPSPRRPLPRKPLPPQRRTPRRRRKQPLASQRPIPGVPASDQAVAAEKPELPKVPKDELARPGYLPGYRRYPWVGLPPHVPHSASAFGGTVAPYGSQGSADVWNFNYSGFFAAGVRAVIRERPLPPGSERDTVALRNAVQSGEPFSAGGTQGSWVQMTFEYGNRIATAHVNLTTWNPSRGASFTQLGSQNFIDQAYLTLRIPPIAKLRIGMAIGAFAQSYGNLGQYGGGFYPNATGSIRGMGETVSIEYDLTDTIVLTADHGIMGSDKAPGGCEQPPSSAGQILPCPTGTSVATSGLGDSYDPARLGSTLSPRGDPERRHHPSGSAPLLQNCSQDDRGLLPVS